MVKAGSNGGGTGTGRGRSPRGQGEFLRRDILAAVHRLLAEWGGIEKLTVRAVAAEVGVSAPSIYLHFADKTELLWAALASRYEDLASRMAADDAAAASRGARERLRAQAHAYCRFGLAHPGHYRLMFEVRQPEVDAARISRHPARQVSGNLREAFGRCREEGYGLAMPVEQAAHTLWAGLHGSVSLTHSLFDDSSLDGLLLDVADGLLDALVAPAPGADRAWPSAAANPVSLRIRSIAALGPAPGQAPATDADSPEQAGR
ncbi:TetR/AcrR family transcriptional regulator [Streptomyces sp. MAA16]|uniref:TetR/AcrR family transcriptional regulator n=1 Tax=Streptomyces sp. MAA16 TaxID=3035116 RepID=UPI00247675E8|nr:TetR/AcrR family transcriptional regulator [Streptomyces sp. MAA16]MDH6696306.1 AcrR family transcriptional regulator [Streptomyces sp. MAA16]